jgi:hypothetical protein
MRTPEELIALLEAAASMTTGTVALVVAFEETSVMISPKQEDRLEELSMVLKGGGEPIGLITVNQVNGVNGKEVNVRSDVFPEYEGEEREQLGQYLKAISETFAESMVKTYGGHLLKK